MKKWTINPYADVFLKEDQTLLIYIFGDYKCIKQQEIKNIILQTLDSPITLKDNFIEEKGLENILIPFSYEKEKIMENKKLKISFHSHFYIISDHNVCHECILRWLPRNENIDKYISMLTGVKDGILLKKALPANKEIFEYKLPKEGSFVIIDINGEVIFEETSPPIHPECTNNNHKFSFGEFQKLLYTPFKDKHKSLVWYFSKQHKDVFGNHHVMCVINSPSTIINEKFVSGWGVDKDLQVAKLKALVESIERFHTYLPPQRSNPVYANEQLVLNNKMEKFNPFLSQSEQYTSKIFVPYNAEEFRWWIEAEIITDKSREFLPTDYVLLKDISPNKKSLMFPTSTGMAAHTNEEECIKNALLEVIERYGQYTFWVYNDFNKVQINTLKEFKVLRSYIEAINNTELHVHIWLKEILGVPVVIAALEKMEDGKSIFIFGSSCDVDIEFCVKQALEEAYGQYLHSRKYSDGDININEVSKPIDHLKYYLKKENSNKLSRYFNIDEKPLPQKNKNDITIDNVISEAKKNDLKIYLVDRGSAFSDSIGIFVKQVIIPQLPYLNFKFEELRFPKKISSELRGFLQTVPHPFS
ncbi:hypothetical protein JCM12214_28740 [Geobacillus vulcani]